MRPITLDETSPCACHSGQAFSDCCGDFLRGLRKPGTAEQLMRSRFSAYVLKRVDYLLETHHPKTRSRDLAQGIKETAENTTWIGLQVLGATGGQASDKKGIVTFRATYSQAGKIGEHCERSRFARYGGDWSYVDGEVS